MDAARMLAKLGGVADTAALVAATSRRKVRTAVAAGAIIRDGRGCYVLPTAEQAARAAARLSGVVSHASAASHWGWKVKWPPRLPSVTVPRNRNIRADRREGVEVHYGHLSDTERNERVTLPGRTVMDCAKTLPFDEALAIADSALRNDDVTRGELLWLAERVRTTGRAGCLRVASEADARAHNPFESVLRALALEVDGLHLEPQVVLVEGAVHIQPDLTDVERRIVVEAESYEFHSDRKALGRDCERYNALGRSGWTVYRFTWEHAMFRPEYVTEVLTGAVAAADSRPRRRAARARSRRDGA
jgi:very-short-patch-repair endonuclease